MSPPPNPRVSPDGDPTPLETIMRSTTSLVPRPSSFIRQAGRSGDEATQLHGWSSRHWRKNSLGTIPTYSSPEHRSGTTSLREVWRSKYFLECFVQLSLGTETLQNDDCCVHRTYTYANFFLKVAVKSSRVRAQNNEILTSTCYYSKLCNFRVTYVRVWYVVRKSEDSCTLWRRRPRLCNSSDGENQASL